MELMYLNNNNIIITYYISNITTIYVIITIINIIIFTNDVTEFSIHPQNFWKWREFDVIVDRALPLVGC